MKPLSSATTSLLLLAAPGLLPGCCQEPDSIWDRYLWIEIVGLDRSTTEATVTTGAGDWEMACDVGLAPNSSFLDVVSEDCPEATAVGAVEGSFFVQYWLPSSRRFRVGLTFTDEDGEGGFETDRYQADWTRRFWEEGEGFCGAERHANIRLSAAGNAVTGP